MARQSLTQIVPEDIRTGMTIRIHQKIREKNPKGEEKERIQVYEGLVIQVKGSKQQKTMTVRKISNGVAVEKIFPIYLPAIAKIELVSQVKVNRNVLSFVRHTKKRLKEITPKLLHPIQEEEPKKAEAQEATPEEEPEKSPEPQTAE